MNRESFIDTIRHQYAVDIKDVYLECLHQQGRQLDFDELNSRLNRLLQNALVDGLPFNDYVELVRTTLPDAVGRVCFEIRKAA